MMESFEYRRDRFEFYNKFENPLLNITFNLELPDFRPACKEKGLPPFHFFLYALFQSLYKVENFRYRIFQDQVIMVDRLLPSYTVMNKNNVLNFTRFEACSDLNLFIEGSLKARDEAVEADHLLHVNDKHPERETKDYVFVTCLPWLEFTSIQHPTRILTSSDIPAIAWGKMKLLDKSILSFPFSVQGHHGFIDGYHIFQLGEVLKEDVTRLISK